MIRSQDINYFIDELSKNQVLQVNYKGFLGRGINGVKQKTMYLCKILPENENIVCKIKESNSRSTKVQLTKLYVAQEYIVAEYLEYNKNYSQSSWQEGKSYTLIVPYDSIESMEIYKLKEE